MTCRADLIKDDFCIVCIVFISLFMFWCLKESILIPLTIAGGLFQFWMTRLKTKLLSFTVLNTIEWIGSTFSYSSRFSSQLEKLEMMDITELFKYLRTSIKYLRSHLFQCKRDSFLSHFSLDWAFTECIICWASLYFLKSNSMTL